MFVVVVVVVIVVDVVFRSRYGVEFLEDSCQHISSHEIAHLFELIATIILSGVSLHTKVAEQANSEWLLLSKHHSFTLTHSIEHTPHSQIGPFRVPVN